MYPPDLMHLIFIKMTSYKCTLRGRCILCWRIETPKFQLTGIYDAWHKCRCLAARWKVGKCWEDNRAGAALSWDVARLLSARFSGGWSGCCCCCSPGMAMAQPQSFSHPVLSVLFNYTTVNYIILKGTSVWQESEKLWNLSFLSSWFSSDLKWQPEESLHPFPWSALVVSNSKTSLPSKWSFERNGEKLNPRFSLFEEPSQFYLCWTNRQCMEGRRRRVKLGVEEYQVWLFIQNPW